MGPIVRTSMVIFAAVFTKSLLLGWWERYKAKKAAEPIPTKLRAGRYVAWGAVQKVQHYGWRATQVWMGYIAVLLGLLAYTKVVGPIF